MKDSVFREQLNQVRNGDREAFASIYQELKRPVFVVIWRIVLNRETAEDLTQDLFVKLFLSPPDSSVTSPQAWIFRMARNLAIDFLRKKQAVPIDEEKPDGDDRIGNLLTRMDLETAMHRLDEEERQILALHLDADLPFHQIAQITGLSMAAVYRRYRRAIGKCQTYLNGGNP